MFVYFSILCIEPVYCYEGIENYYADLILNYNNYFNYYTEPWNTRFDEFDWLIYLELMELTSEYFIDFPYFDEKGPVCYTFNILKLVVSFFAKVLMYVLFLMFLFRVVILDGSIAIGLINVNALYFEYEHNVGNGEDLLMVVSFVFSVALLLLLYQYVTCAYIEVQIILVYIYVVFVLIPIRIVLAFGCNFINYIRGCVSSSKYSTELFSDTMLLLVFFTRFSLQAIRIVLIYGFYFSLHEYVFILPKNYITFLLNKYESWGANLLSNTLTLIR